MTLTEERLLESGARSEYKPLTLDEIKQILKNQELRKEIVDIADIWDGPESSRYGNTLTNILKKLDINDVPDFYEKNNIDKLIKKLVEKRNKK